MSEKHNSYTPKAISETAERYSIPIYQRLFEWGDENIETLLSDLWHRFNLSEDENYYIGMLTSTKDRQLIDGQQRFVVMMLIGCVLKEYEGWGKFIMCEDKPRLHFASRPHDNKYLMSRINDSEIESGCVNVKMQRGIEKIESFFNGLGDDDKRHFSKYIFTHLNFFVSELPENYSPTDLNTYFERMNTTGKNLEQHEILKVKLLRHFGNESGRYMQLWNKLADVDTLLVRKREGEKEDDFRGRKNLAVQADLQSIMAGDIINGLHVNDSEEVFSSIEQIAPSREQPASEIFYVQDSRSPLRFPQLLLQTLYFIVTKKGNVDGEKDEVSKEEFFNTNNLLATFEKYLPYEGDMSEKRIEDIRMFIQKLLTFRLILDICFVRPMENGYYLDMNLLEEEESKAQLMMYESMLYVSSSYATECKWFGWLMEYFSQLPSVVIPRADELCRYFKKRDNDDHNNRIPSSDELSYGRINRYWFWRLDYYLWEDREDLFRGETQKVADNYIFRRNRSIEHIVPQTPQTESTLKWSDKPDDRFNDGDVERIGKMLENEDIQINDLWNSLNDDEKKVADRIIRNSFGNLAMISSGLNSSLSNESYEIKRARVDSYCKKSIDGSIESLNLLWVYKEDYGKWNEETFRGNIIKHGREMVRRLKRSFEEKPDTDSQNSPE